MSLLIHVGGKMADAINTGLREMMEIKSALMSGDM
jgi:hypothetical protein